MPRYEFECVYAHCDERQEIYFDMHTGPPSRTGICPTHKEPLRRAYTRPALAFKGAGWASRPAIFDDPIAKDHPGQYTNYGNADRAEYLMDSEIKDDRQSQPFEGYKVIEEPKGDVIE